jgi:transcription elongation factor Elf1
MLLSKHVYEWQLGRGEFTAVVIYTIKYNKYKVKVINCLACGKRFQVQLKLISISNKA